jgi:hypothetical protein
MTLDIPKSWPNMPGLQIVFVRQHSSVTVDRFAVTASYLCSIWQMFLMIGFVQHFLLQQ